MRHVSHETACQNRCLLRRFIYLIVTLAMANLGAVTDLFIHPQIPYFDIEHLYGGGLTALLVACLFVLLEFYLLRLYGAIEAINRFASFISICSNCHKVHLPDHDAEQAGSWVDLQKFIQNTTNTQISHGICPDCAELLYGHLKGEGQGASAG